MYQRKFSRRSTMGKELEGLVFDADEVCKELEQQRQIFDLSMNIGEESPSAPREKSNFNSKATFERADEILDLLQANGFDPLPDLNDHVRLQERILDVLTAFQNCKNSSIAKENIALTKGNDALKNRLESYDPGKITRMRDELKSMKEKLQGLYLKTEKAQSIIRSKETTIQKLKAKLKSVHDQNEKAKYEAEVIFTNTRSRKPRTHKDREIVDIIATFSEERVAMKSQLQRIKKELETIHMAQIAASTSGGKKIHLDCDFLATPPCESDYQSNKLVSRVENWKKPKPTGSLSAEALNDLQERLEQCEEKLKSAKMKIKELNGQKERLEKELNMRLSPGERKKFEETIRNLQIQLREAEKCLELQNPMSTRARIKKDKRLYELGVKGPKATKLPARIKDQLVEDLCYEFDITEPTQIVASLRKMKKVIEIAPKMEHFIRELYLVMRESEFAPELQAEDDTSNIYQRMKPILERWVKHLGEFTKLRSFQDCLNQILESEGLLSCSGICAKVQSLKSRTQAMELYEEAEKHIHESPSGDLANDIVKEFQKLFNVHALSGVIPKMHQVQMDLESKRNFVKRVRFVLKLDDSASLHEIFSKIREYSEDGLRDEEGIILLELMNETGIEKFKLVDLVKEMKEKIQDFEKVYPRLLTLVGKLRDLLQITSTSNILGEVEKLVRLHGAQPHVQV